jgi:hypothetical protein
MERISSRQTFFLKHVLPFICLGVSMPQVIVSIFTQTTTEIRLRLLGVFVLFGLIALAMSGIFSWFFVDEVWDSETHLVIKKGKWEIVVPICEIARIEKSAFVRPGYATLVLNKQSALGTRINYHPRDSWGISFPYETCASVARLEEKVMPNQSPHPTPASGTPPAEQESRLRGRG